MDAGVCRNVCSLCHSCGIHFRALYPKVLSQTTKCENSPKRLISQSVTITVLWVNLNLLPFHHSYFDSSYSGSDDRLDLQTPGRSTTKTACEVGVHVCCSIQ